jgi:PhoPQ-activated pathogenicity-related protein
MKVQYLGSKFGRFGWYYSVLLMVGLGCAGSATANPAGSPPLTNALTDYVQKPDAAFTWKKVEQRQIEDCTAYRLNCTSQNWRDHLWQHQMIVVKPPKVRNPGIAFLLITGGGAERAFPMLKAVATEAGAIAAVISDVPNEPIFGLSEDALIAYTFDHYLKSGDRTWPLLFPMTKSAVRGMDTVQAFSREELKQSVKQFIVSGASKRGWTTWLTAAVDPRVTAIAPMVIDMLNMKVQTRWTTQMYGRQSEQIKDYTNYNFTERMEEPEMQELIGWVDPYSYRSRYTMPKLLLLGTNDPYWVVDSLRNYWYELPDPKLVFQTPNAGHNLGGGKQATQSLAAFCQMISDHQTLPRMTWTFSTNSDHSAGVQVQVMPPAQSFKLWTATSPVRDFRRATWTSTNLPAATPGTINAEISTPETGFRAYLVEAEMKGPAGESYKLSTEARVTPDGPPARMASDHGGTAGQKADQK